MLYAENWDRDLLTDCYTRSSLSLLLEKLCMESGLTNRFFSIMFIDLDRFKVMNDKYGHIFGDKLLKYFSSSLRLSTEVDEANKEEQKLIFRYGGDEFIIVFPAKTSRQAYLEAIKISNIIKKRPFLFYGRQFKITFSGGIANYPNDGRTAQELIGNADKAMYFSKKQGRGRITQYGKITIEKNMQLVLKFSLIVGILIFIWALFSGEFKNLISSSSSVSAVMPSWLQESPKQSQAYDIYLKSGEKLTGIIVSDGDPIKIQLTTVKQGAAYIELDKAEISQVLPAE